MKALIILFTIALLALSACAPDLPPEPEAPGPIDGSLDVPQDSDVTGLAVADQRDGITWSLTNNVGLPSNTFTFTATGSNRDFSMGPADDAIYQTAYYALEGDTTWTPFTLSGSSLGGNWLKDSGSGQINLDTTALGLATSGDNNEIYFVTYTCTRQAFSWNCHGSSPSNGLWQIDSVVVDLSLSCADQGKCDESGVCYDVGQENPAGTQICRADLSFSPKTCSEQGFLCEDSVGGCFNVDEYSSTDNAICLANSSMLPLPGEPPSVG